VNDKKEISREKIKRALRKKDEKAMELDGVPREAWKYGGKRLERWARDYCNGMWKEEEWPESWKEGMVVPIVKKREREKVEEYRGITVMAALYKIYVSVLEGERRGRG